MKTIRLRAVGLALVATVRSPRSWPPRPRRVQQATTITLWNTMNDQETVTFKSVIADFEKANPDIKVNLVQVPFDQRETKFTTAVQAGAGPDIMRAEIADVANWAQPRLPRGHHEQGHGRRQEGLPAVRVRVLQLRGQDLGPPAGARRADDLLQQGAVQGGRHQADAAAEDARPALQRRARSSATARASSCAPTPTGCSPGCGATAAG